MAKPKDPALEHLRTAYRIHTSYPWYQGWKYDRPDAQDPFIQNMVADLRQSPETLAMLHALRADLYLCRDLGQTHLKDQVFWGDVRISPAICMRADMGEIALAREFYRAGTGVPVKDRDSAAYPHYADLRKEGFVRVETTDLAFIIAHELAHVLDTALGRYPNDPDAERRDPTTRIDLYAKSALMYDTAFQATLPVQFKVRAGLLGDGKVRHSETEIVCDLIAYAWSGHEPETYRALAEAYPALQKVAETMRLAAASETHKALYRQMALRQEPLGRIREALETAGFSPSGGSLQPGL